MKKFYEKYEKYFSPIAFLAGFTWDNLTLTRVDLWVDNLIMIGYIFIASGGIFIANLTERPRYRDRIFEKYSEFIPLISQFAFGGLFSAFFVFYSRSADITQSWPFLITLTVFLIGNEFLRKHYMRLIFQISVFFIVTFSYSIFAVPILVKKIGPEIFILSGIISLFLTAIFTIALELLAPARSEQSRGGVILSISAIYVIFNILYFSNLIPPIPLSLKDGGIFHFVARDPSGEYLVEYELNPSGFFLIKPSVDFHWIPGKPVYAFSSIFAPTKLDTTIFHRWSYFDEQNKKWITTDRLRFAIYGGRDGGYRGFTLKYAVHEGRWRVDVETASGQILGRMKFTIIRSDNLPQTQNELR